VNAPQKPHKRLILIMLLVIFAAPPALSWLIFRFTEIGRGGTGHGQLIEPPRALPDVQLADAAGGSATLHGSWTLLYLAPDGCPATCREALYRMRQVRLALGRDMERMQRVLVFPAGAAPLSELAAEWPGQRFVSGVDAAFAAGGTFSLGPGDDPITAGRLYVVDPRGFLMMSYAPDAGPDGIIADLKRLLRYSRSGG
jgi:cytochrome oxidase Cu insertion factor (SCO1/SenC/PrrC family)